MASKQYFELVKSALPPDVNPNELRRLAPDTLWNDNPYLASALALRLSNRFNWDAYSVRNEDVRNSVVDPCIHYIKYGIYEGRKLISWHELKEPDNPDNPLVSIIIINYNNAHLVGKCLDSVVTQTLEDIEIIIVDDCSTDESLSIINDYAKKDARINVIVNEKNSATLITRKRGVKAATGRYIMFLDSDDYMVPDACEVAYRSISLGYDMVKFGSYVFNSMNVADGIIRRALEWCNMGENREYTHDEIITNTFKYRKMNWIVWSNIYLREIVVAAFDELPDEYFTGPDDLLAVMAITRRVRNMKKIANKLYYYNYGPGVSLTSDKAKLVKYLPARCNTIKYIRDYANKYALNVDIERLYMDLCDVIIEKFLPIAHDEDVPDYFWHISDIVGFKYVLRLLIERHGRHDDKLAALIRPLPAKTREIKHIGIYYPVIGKGGVEVIIQTTCRLFENSQCRVTVFTEERSEQDLEFPPAVEIVQIQPAFSGDVNLLQRMQGFENAISASGIDVMLHAGTWRAHILWDVMVLHQHAIPVIFLYHFNFALSLARIGPELNFQDMVFKCAEAVTCLSTMEELYLRSRGINAIYLPNPIKQIPYVRRDTIPTKIAVVGRFGSHVKQVYESMKVLREVVARAPWIIMYLIGDFQSDEQRQKFWQKTDEYGLRKNIILTGWTDDPDYFLRQCGVFLSTSYWEAFPMGIAEAQAMGLPCVIYDLTIEQAKNNPSIIKVPQGDYMAAAARIIDLVDNQEIWCELSQIAVENCKKYTVEKYQENLQWLLDNFQTGMPVRKYSNEDYVEMARSVSFYSKYKSQELWD